MSLCTAAILAGGQARRLGGRDKSALLVGGWRIIDRQIAVLREVTDRIAIVANDAGRYGTTGVPVWADLRPDTGPLGGIYTALVHATTAQILVMACDMPFLQAPFLRYLVECGREVDAAVPRSPNGYEPLCASYGRQSAELIRARIDRGQLDLMGLLDKLRVRVIAPEEIAPFDPAGTLFFNINTPEDYARSLSLVRYDPSDS